MQNFVKVKLFPESDHLKIPPKETFASSSDDTMISEEDSFPNCDFLIDKDTIFSPFISRYTHGFIFVYFA